MINIIIADDHPIVRNGIRQLTSDELDMELVGEAHSCVELLGLLRERSCDVLLLDVSLPDRSGLSVVAEIKSKWPQVAVLMLTMHPEAQYAVRAFESGAVGYVTKSSPPAELCCAIRRVATGRKYVTSALAESLVDQLGGGNRNGQNGRLTEREHEVLRKIAAGLPVNRIADDLFLSASTVSTYRSRLLAKLNLHTTAELIRYAITNKLID